MFIGDLINPKFLYISQEISNSFPQLAGSQGKKPPCLSKVGCICVTANLAVSVLQPSWQYLF